MKMEKDKNKDNKHGPITPNILDNGSPIFLMAMESLSVPMVILSKETGFMASFKAKANILAKLAPIKESGIIINPTAMEFKLGKMEASTKDNTN